MKKLIMFFSAVTFLLSFTTIVKAELFDRGSGLVYDDVLNITWLQNANYSGETMTWINASNWASDLVFQDYNDWRLPYSDASCTGSSCTESEMGHLYYDDSITSDSSGIFTDVRSYMYWSGTDNNEDSSKALRFHFNTGYQGSSGKTYSRYAWAVRDGDIALPVAPEPVSTVLFITGGIVLLAGHCRRGVRKA